MSEKVTIYRPDGGAELHTRANARDLINNGYTWEPGRPVNPASSAPYAVPDAKAKKISPTQEILDRIGTGATSEPPPPREPRDTDPVIEVPVEAPPAPVAEEVAPEAPIVEVASEEPVSASETASVTEPATPRNRAERRAAALAAAEAKTEE